jgi:hypothetical protein
MPTTPDTPECTGDCNGDSHVDVAEIVIGIAIGLEQTDLSSCAAIDANHSGAVEINEPVAAVGNSLEGCPD